MKAITLWEPWATLVAHEYKKYETRSWEIKHRGDLVIHAAKRIPRVEDSLTPRIIQALKEIGIEAIGDFPFGCAVAVVSVVKVFRTETLLPSLDSAQQAFGDFSPKRYAWQLANIYRFPPIPMTGRQGIWWLTGENEQRIKEMMKDRPLTFYSSTGTPIK